MSLVKGVSVVVNRSGQIMDLGSIDQPCAGVYSKKRNDTLQDTDGTTPMKALYKSVVGTARAY